MVIISNSVIVSGPVSELIKQFEKDSAPNRIALKTSSLKPFMPAGSSRQLVNRVRMPIKKNPGPLPSLPQGPKKGASGVRERILCRFMPSHEVPAGTNKENFSIIVRPPLSRQPLRPLPKLPQVAGSFPVRREFKPKFCEKKGVAVTAREVEDFVVCFLHPYLSRYCRPEDEPKNRTSMMDLLFRRFEQEGKVFDRLRVEQIAFDHYLLQAACGAHRFLHQDILEQLSPAYISARLIEALKPALQKDFPRKKIAEHQLKTLAHEAIEKYYAVESKTREECEQETQLKYENHIKAKFKKRTIVKMLKESRKLFVADIPAFILKVHSN